LNKAHEVQPIPLAASYKASVCDRSFARTACLNPAGGMDIRLLWFFVLSGRILYDELITRPEESYLVGSVYVCVCVCVCVSLSVIRWNNLQCIGRKGQNEKDRKKWNVRVVWSHSL